MDTPATHEAARLAALRRYAVLDRGPDPSLDRLARLAARVLRAPYAAITLMESDRVKYKSRIDVPGDDWPRDRALCDVTVGTAAFHQVPDTTRDPFSAAARLCADRGLRFYAGCPLLTPDGYAIGTLCVLDHAPRAGLAPAERATLEDIAATVMIELERRRQAALLVRASERLALINDILACVGGAEGFVAAIEAAIMRLCRQTGAQYGHLWDHTLDDVVRLAGFAADVPIDAAFRSMVFEGFDPVARITPMGELLSGDGPHLAPDVKEADVAHLPLMLASYEHGMRSFLIVPLPVGDARYALILKFPTPRDDLAEIAELLDEVGQAIRPALQRKQAEDRLALINDVLAAVGGAAGFAAAIEGALTLLCRHVGAKAGQLWDDMDHGAMVRLVALAGPGEIDPGLRARTFARFPVPAERSMLAPVMAKGGRMTMASIRPELAEGFPLLQACLNEGVRSFAAHGFAVGSGRYMLVIGFETERRDLDRVVDLLAEVVQAIRPALHRMRAEARLALLNEVVERVGAVTGFVPAVEAAMDRLGRHIDAMFGMLWSLDEAAGMINLVAMSVSPSLGEGYREGAHRQFPAPASGSLMAATLLQGEGRTSVPLITDELAERYPLLAMGRSFGMRSYVAQSLQIGSMRYLVLFGFPIERQDLDRVSDLLMEVSQALRPALQREQAQERLTLLRAAVDATADAVAITDDDGTERRIRYVNPAFAQMSGRPAEALFGRGLALLHGPSTDPAAIAAIAAAQRDGQPAWQEMQLHRHDGAAFWAELGITPIRGEQGAVTHWVAVLRDSSARRAGEEALQRMAAALQERTRDLSAMARRARLGSWRLHLDTGLIDWSDDTYALFGVTRGPEPLREEDFFPLLHPDDRERAREACRRSMELGVDLQMEARVPIAGGKQRVLVWSGSCTRGPDGRVVEIAGYAQDVTERREAEAALLHGEKLKSLGKLTGGIAHEFNNLLTVMLGGIEIALESQRGTNESTTELEAARHAALGATELTRRLLAFGRVEPLRAEPTDLAHWLDSLRDMARMTLGSRYRVLLHADRDLPPVLVDRGQLESAVLNLILNARDAMPNGGAISIEADRVEVAASGGGAIADLAPGGYAAIAVRDHGPGMPPEVLERAFEPFFTTKASGSGTGLGLSMVLSFARRSGGAALLDSRPGQGTTVRILLPL